MLLSADRSALLVVDIQERLLPAVHEGERVVAKTRILLQAAGVLNVPAFASEQYVKGLGGTAPAVAELLDADARLDKISFSCLREPTIADRLRALGRDQIVLCGIESHVCVLQTALDLRAQGRETYVVADAVSSRAASSVDLALARMANAGVHVVNTEMAVFEWMERAGSASFRTVSALIK